jgi:glycosyltransferase involved in cell wall biosynthesis
MADLTIIIPTYNRGDILRETLDSLSRLDTPDISYEVIVVDNNSSDHTKEVVESFFDKIPIRYLFEVKQGKNYAVNSAIENSQGDVLVFIDDDVTVETDYLKKILRSIEKYKSTNIFGGKILTKWPVSTPPWVHYSSKNFPYLFCDHNLGSEVVSYSEAPLPGGANFWVRKSLLVKYGARFNEKVGPSGNKRVAGSETEFLRRMYSKGEKILYIPDVIVHHRVLASEFSITKILHRFSATGKSSVSASSRDSDTFIFNIPIYLYNQIFQEIIKFFLYVAIFNKDKYMNSLIKVGYFYGRFKGFALLRNKA